MRSSKIILAAFLFLGALSAAAQTTDKSFSRDGLSFSYPLAWTLDEKASTKFDDFNFLNPSIDVQLLFSVSKPLDPTPENIAKAKKTLFDPYVAASVKSFEDAGAKPQSSPATSEIGGVPSTGVLVAITLGGATGNAQFQSAVVGDRLIIFTLLGPTTDTKKAAAAWDMLRTTIKIEAQKPPASPAKKP